MFTFLTWQLADQIAVWGLNVLFQASAITVLSLFVAALLRRQPAVRHVVLCGALFLLVATPVMALVMQVSGRSLLVLSLSMDQSQRSANVAFDEEMPIPGHSAAGLPRVLSQASLSPDPADPIQPGSASHKQPEGHGLEDANESPPAVTNRAELKRLPGLPSERPVPAENAASGPIGRFVRRVILPLVCVWFIGGALLLYRTADRWIKLTAMLRASRPVACERINAARAEVCRSLGVQTPPALRLSPLVATPLAAGLLRPTVVLPEAIVGSIDSDQLRQVLAHELAHVVRRDPAVALVQNIVGAMFWIHPLVLILNRQLARAREEVCDNFVLRLADPPRYSRTLLRVAELTADLCPLPEPVGLLTSRWRLETRIAGILDNRRNLRTQVALAVKTIVAASLLLTATVAATVTISRTAALVAVGDDRPSTIPANGPAEQIKVGANAEEATDALPPGALFRLGNGRFRHEGWNKNVAYAANGKVLVTCSERSLKIWDAKTGKLLRQAPLADSIHRAMRVFADGKRLATLGGRIGKGTEPFGTWWLRVWDVETAEVVSEISHSRISFGEMRALAISPDGTLAFLGDSTGSIYIYELATGLKMLQYRVADLRDVNGIALSPDGQIAAITTGSNQLFLWHWSSGDDLVQLQSGRRYLGVAFSPDGKRLAVGSDSRNDVQVWDIATRRLLQTLEDTPKVPLLVEELAFTPDGTKLAAANCVMLSNQFAAAVLIWDLASGKLVHRFAFQGMHPRSLSLSPDGRSIAAVDWDVGFRVWDIETGHSRGNATAGHSGSIRAMLYSPTSGEIVTASSDRTARIWDARTGREIAKLDHDAEVFALAQSADGRLLATATQNDTISLWESSPVQKLRTIKRGGRSLGGTVSLAFASDGRELLALEDDLHLCICGVADGSIRREIELRPSGMNLAVEGGEDVREVAMRLVTAHAFTSDSSKFVLAGSEGFWWTFDAKSGGEIARHILPVQPRTIAIDPGSRHIAFAGGTRHDAGATDKIASDIEKTAELVVLDFDTGKAVWRAQRQDPYWRPNGFGPLRFSNDGIWIAVAVRGHEGPEIELYDAATGQRRKQLAGGDPAGWSNQGLAFSTDGSRLASIQADATVLIWNLTAIKK